MDYSAVVPLIFVILCFYWVVGLLVCMLYQDYMIITSHYDDDHELMVILFWPIVIIVALIKLIICIIRR